MKIEHQLILTIDRSISQIINNVPTKFKLFFVFIRTDIEYINTIIYNSYKV